jgi:glycosyltransferase involved in cell wall biosynthesis
MNDVHLTVLLASRNGGAVLPRTLDGYRRAATPPVGWKIVVVDNGSTDDTQQVIESFKASLPIEGLRQPVPGKNRALNTGLGAVEGRLAIITDDDAIPEPSFLVEWAKILKDDHGCELFGGSISPLFDTPPPSWLLASRASFALMFSERDQPEGPIPAEEIYGPNMAVASSVLSRGFRFDEDLGPSGRDPEYPMGSETEFCRRLAAAGVRSWFVRDARVHHIVRPSQLTSANWAKRSYRCGKGRAHQMWKRGDVVRAPGLSLADLFGLVSLSRSRRLQSLSARELDRGFHDECLRRLQESATLFGPDTGNIPEGP